MLRSSLPVRLATSILGLATAAVAQDAATRFADHWYRGEAELSRFELSQSRYGEPRAGHMVLVFVTEDFRTDLQVKDESGGAADTPSTSVLKLNRIQRFSTGVYDYSLMQSVFTPVAREAEPRTLKTTASIQDWCGHAWTQLNLEGDEYRVTGHSYFEREADSVSHVPATLLEDEVLNLVRLDPGALPVGELEVVPSAFDARLRHRPLRVERAVATLIDSADDERTYELVYPDVGRRFSVRFERAFPHRIVALREQVGESVTEAVRTHTVTTAYWNRNRRADDGARAELGLDVPVLSAPEAASAAGGADRTRR